VTTNFAIAAPSAAHTSTCRLNSTQRKGRNESKSGETNAKTAKRNKRDKSDTKPKRNRSENESEMKAKAVKQKRKHRNESESGETKAETAKRNHKLVPAKPEEILSRHMDNLLTTTRALRFRAV